MPEGTSYIQPADTTKEWQTPYDLFDKLHREFRFNVDPCCRPTDHSATEILEKKRTGRIIVPEDESRRRGVRIGVDGLRSPWVDARGNPGRVYMNPPYGLALREWTDRAVAEVENGNALFVVALVPSKTDTQWWTRNVVQRFDVDPVSFEAVKNPMLAQVRFLPSRLTFHGAPDPAGFASAIVVWHRHDGKYWRAPS